MTEPLLPEDAQPKTPLVIANPWGQLQQFTPARLALGRSGVSMPTQPQLAFQLAHAKARDAVHLPMNIDQLTGDLSTAGLTVGGCLALESAAVDRLTYLQRPDLGRQLSAASRAVLEQWTSPPGKPGYDVAFVVADGLSALAVADNAVPLLSQVLPMVQSAGWTVAPLVLVRLGRVAVADAVGELLGAKVVLLVIGERPGLSAPDSLGIYMTWAPRTGLSDANRNCISNVRAAGLNPADAAARVFYLLTQMKQRGFSGIGLKDESTPVVARVQSQSQNFLLGQQRHGHPR